MLDTDICSYIIRQSPVIVASRLERAAISSTCISVITKAELLYGVEISPRRDENERAVFAFLEKIRVLALPESILSEYARIRALLKRPGTPIGGNDLLIAAHALALELILVTNNTREFNRVPELRVENWSEAH